MSPSDPDELRAFCFPTALGPMAVAWALGRVQRTHLPDADEAALLASVRKAWRRPNLQWSPESSAPDFARSLAAQMQRHAAGTFEPYAVEFLNLAACPPFFRRVYESAHAIPPGQTRTYKELALAAGSPLASRAVGQAMARNPFPLVIPCHRVLGTGHAGGFSAPGGLATKDRLLQLESHAN